MPLLIVLGFAGFASAVALRAADPTIPAIAGDFGIDIHTAALTASAYSLPYAAMQLVLGPIGDAIGKARLIKISLVVLFVAMVLSALAPTFPLMITARVLAGAFAGGIIPVAFALIGDLFPYETRQIAISRFLFASILGQMSGSAFAGLITDAYGWRGVFLACATAAGLGVALNVLFLKVPPETRSRLSFRTAMARYRSVFENRNAPIVLGTVALEGIIVFGVFPFTAPMLANHGSGTSFEAGVVLGAYAAGGILYTLAVRTLIARLGVRGMMAGGGALLGAVYVATALPIGWHAVAALFFIAGFAFYMLHNNMQTLATELSPAARGSALSLFAGIFFAGQGLGPVVAGAAAGHIGLTGVFVACGILIAILGIAASRLIRL